jgi:hypothetical protein
MRFTCPVWRRSPRPQSSTPALFETQVRPVGPRSLDKMTTSDEEVKYVIIMTNNEIIIIIQ